MKTKHIIVEILPRLTWLIEIFCLVVVNIFKKPIYSGGLTGVIGLLIAVAGAVLLIWSFKVIAKAMISKKLIIIGPYKIIRHPIYTTIYILLVGLGIMYYSGLWFLVLAVFIPIWYLIALAEESQMSDLYKSEYSEYKKQSGMFLPWL